MTSSPSATPILERRYPAAPHAVAQARRELEQVLPRLRPSCLDTLRLLVSEVVTNAIRHGPAESGETIAVRVTVMDDLVRIEVQDAGKGFARPRRPAADGSGGWGLYLVDQLADRWGIEGRAPTRVWFELETCLLRDEGPVPGEWPESWDRLVVDQVGLAVMAMDPAGVVTRWNGGAETLFGWTEREAVGARAAELVLRPEDEASERFREVVSSRGSWEGEWEARRRDGSPVQVHVVGSPVRDQDGVQLGFATAWFDVSDRKRVERELESRVGELRESERKLHEGEQRLRIALSAGGMGTWDWDVPGARMQWSANLHDIHGLARGSFEGTFEHFSRVVHPEDRERVVEAIHRALQGGTEYFLDYRIIRPDGTVRWLTSRGQVFRDHHGRAVRMAGVSSDATDRKDVERRLSVQYGVSQVLAAAGTLQDATPQLAQHVAEALGWELGTLWDVDEGAGVLRFAGGWCSETSRAGAFLGKCRDFLFTPGVGLPGRVWSSAQPAWIPDVALDDNFPRAPFAAQGGLHTAIAFPITLGEQVLGVMEFFSPRIREPDAELLDMMMAVSRQISQFIERRQAEGALVQSDARKSAILRSSLEAIITMREDGTIVEMNPAAERMFGIGRDAAIGRDLAETIIPERLRRRHREALQRYRATGEGRLLGNRMELAGLRADGTEFPVELTVTKVELPGPGLFTGYVRDITDRKRTEELRTKLLQSERAARAESEAARERMTYLAEASVILASSLDVRRTLAEVARLSVPRLADWCSVEMLRPDGTIESVAVTHVDPTKVAFAREYRRRYPPTLSPDHVIGRVIQSGTSELFTDLPDELLERWIDDPERLELTRKLAVRSAMVVPLVVGGRALGAISFASAESGRRLGKAELDLAEDLARRAAVAVDNARLYEERSHVARTLQRSLLPGKLPTVPGLELAAFYQPAGVDRTDVGGDFYDAFEIADGGWGFAIGDVCGKGAEAAALTGLARHALRAAAVHQSVPSAVLRDLNHVLVREDGERFCTVAMGRLLPRGDGASLTVACGGHPLPVVLRGHGAVETVGVPGGLLGIFPNVGLEDRAVRLGPSDTVVFYTDGLIDARRAEVIDDDALEALLQTCRGLDAVATVDRFRDAVADPQGKAPDDIAILALRVKP